MRIRKIKARNFFVSNIFLRNMIIFDKKYRNTEYNPALLPVTSIKQISNV